MEKGVGKMNWKEHLKHSITIGNIPILGGKYYHMLKGNYGIGININTQNHIPTQIFKVQYTYDNKTILTKYGNEIDSLTYSEWEVKRAKWHEILRYQFLYFFKVNNISIFDMSKEEVCIVVLVIFWILLLLFVISIPIVRMIVGAL